MMVLPARHGIFDAIFGTSAGKCPASSTTAKKCLTKYLRRKFSCTLQEIFVILYTGMPYNLLIV
jgi:hypothetical protein